MWGQGSYHQLGIPESCGDVSSPQLIPGLHKLVKVAIGGTQVLAIRRDERTFHWGSDQAGE
jgi:alpha-tubulin suppressor-like RCC1 family protein